MASPILGVGPYRFAVPELNYQELKRDFHYRWEAQERIGRRPAMQFLGPGIESVVLKGVIYPGDPRLGDGFRQLERMRQEAMLGVPRGVASSMGRYYGLWCIVDIRDEQSFFNRHGDPRKVEFKIALEAYGPDGLSFGGLF